MHEIDDSALFHGVYDPVKAREYYLRTRKLKGRRRSTASINNPGKGGRRPSNPPAKPARAGSKANRSKTKSRQAELRAQKEALEKRLDRLREVLAELVAEAKKRSGGDPNKKKRGDEKDKAPETKADKADRNKAEKDRKPLTAKQKADKAKKAKETYEKENPNSLSMDVEILQEQVKDIQVKIQKALADAKARRNKAGRDNTQKSGSKTTNDGPRGR